MSSRSTLRQHNCQFCKRFSVMIIYNHEQTCAKNPNRVYNIAKRYGGRHVSGSDLSLIINRRRLTAGLERPAASSTPLVLSSIGLSLLPDSPLPVLASTDIESVLVPAVPQDSTRPTNPSVSVLIDSSITQSAPAQIAPLPDIVAVSMAAAGLPTTLN
jgi:hypothetical protein